MLVFKTKLKPNRNVMRTWLSALCLSSFFLAQPMLAASTNETGPTQPENVANIDSAVAQNREDFRLFRKIKMNRDLLNIKMDMRIDFDGAVNQHTKDVAAFKANAFKLVLQGDITPNISYLVRQRLNKIGDLGKDNFLAGTDFAFVNFKLGKGWDLTVGKQPVQFGTFEFEYNPADVYFYSLPGSSLQGYSTGINAAYTYKKQQFNFEITDASGPEFSVPGYDFAFHYSFLWVGDMFNGLWKTRWGYNLTNVAKNQTTSWYTFGNQLMLGPVNLQLEYMTGDYYQEDFSNVFTLNSVRQNGPIDMKAENMIFAKDQAAIVRAQYSFGKSNEFVMWLKGIYDQRQDKELNAEVLHRWTGAFVFEYYPFNNTNLNFHFSYGYRYTSLNTAMFSGLPKGNSENMFITGFRWLFNVN